MAVFLSTGQAGAAADTAMQPAIGAWTWDGHFSNEAPISASTTFLSAANGSAVTATYGDVPPEKYHAVGLFGKTRNGAQIENLIDAFSGARRFHGASIANGTAYVNDDGTDRFEYRFRPDSTFDIRYFTTKAGSEHFVDSVHCHQDGSASP